MSPKWSPSLKIVGLASKFVFLNPNYLKQAIHRSSKIEFFEHEKEKPIVKVENLSILEQMIQNGGIQNNLKSKTQTADSNLRPRYEGSGKTEDLPTLALRVEARNETRNPPRWGRGVCVAGILRI
ncbi:hypothetical protein AVEN_107461-1 [Araneus ventricosus]|uniref:Uncharacterized protein n=1 Tax=Araneus ventricosus TaxID=182803 RepID=A0A4Y2G6M7_ARAVE|nr:hypothetical protein AVEN_107461-1 [Araneus ventricosus]